MRTAGNCDSTACEPRNELCADDDDDDCDCDARAGCAGLLCGCDRAGEVAALGPRSCVSASSTACADVELRMLACVPKLAAAPNAGVGVGEVAARDSTSTSERGAFALAIGGDTPMPMPLPLPARSGRAPLLAGVRLPRRAVCVCAAAARGLGVSVPALMRPAALIASVIMFESAGEGGMEGSEGVDMGEDCAAQPAKDVVRRRFAAGASESESESGVGVIGAAEGLWTRTCGLGVVGDADGRDGEGFAGWEVAGDCWKLARGRPRLRGICGLSEVLGGKGGECCCVFSGLVADGWLLEGSWLEWDGISAIQLPICGCQLS